MLPRRPCARSIRRSVSWQDNQIAAALTLGSRFFTSESTGQWSKSRCFCLLRSRLPSIAEAGSRSGRLYQNPLAAAASKSRKHRCAWAAAVLLGASVPAQGGVAGAAAADSEVPAVADSEAPVIWVRTATVPVQSGAGSCHPAVGCNGYTCIHLPMFKVGRILVAMPAIFAARMARSNLFNRCAFK